MEPNHKIVYTWRIEYKWLAKRTALLGGHPLYNEYRKSSSDGGPYDDINSVTEAAKKAYSQLMDLHGPKNVEMYQIFQHAIPNDKQREETSSD